MCRFMSPPLLIQLIKKHAHPEPKCDSEEQQDHECVTKPLNWRICITKTNKHFQKKCWNSSLPPPTPVSPTSSGVPSCLFTDSKGSFSITPGLVRPCLQNEGHISCYLQVRGCRRAIIQLCFCRASVHVVRKPEEAGEP